jgi:hypothetical protein
MEQIKIKVTSSEKSDAIQSHNLFKWNLVSDTKIETGCYLLQFERSENTPNLENIKRMEKEYFRVSKIGMKLIISLMVIAFIYLTVFGVLFLNKIINIDKIARVLILIIPSAIICFIAFLLSKKRMNDMNKYIDNVKQRYLDFKKRIEELDNGHQD